MTGPQTHETPLAGGVSKSAEAGGFDTKASAAVERLQPEFAYSRGMGEHDNAPAIRDAETFAELCDAIASDRATKKGEQWIAAPCAIAPDDALHRARFPSAIGKHHRCKECVQPVAWLGLDVDARKDSSPREVASLTPESFTALVYVLQRYSALVYTTASHTSEAPRCRVVVELDAALPRLERVRASQAMRARIDADMADAGYPPLPWDSSCDRPEQPLYLPVTTSTITVMDGAAARVDELLAKLPAEAMHQAQEAPQGPPVTEPTAYALRALELAVRAVQTTPAGDRNDVLNREAHSLGGFVPSGQLSAAVVEASLTAATEGWDNPAKVLATIRDGIASGMAKPRADGLPPPTVDLTAMLEKIRGQPAGNDPWGFVWGDELTSAARLKPATWAIRKLLPDVCTGLLYGGWGTCKTFVAIDMAGCIANGFDWHGKPTQQGTVIYLAGEGEGGFARRLRAWEIANGGSMANLAFREMPEIRKPDELAQLVLTIRGLAAQRGAPRLIVLDTLFTALAGGQENDGKDMGEVFKAMKAMRQEFQCAVLAVHHTGHDGDRARGHSSMPAGVDVQFYLKAKGEGKAVLELSNPKQKDDKEHPTIFLTTESVEIAGLVDDEGETESSLVVRAPAAELAAKLVAEADKKPGNAALKVTALALAAEGLSTRDIATQVGRHHTTVSRWITPDKAA
ncbi:AAA family ATPase [Luteimonas sp. WGS1318]|uniref:AAA family ATPase n=1 Tax=Luteimonas sp. WGS1318 TaxID=3366815 RepID=UPI00372D1B88